MPELAEVETICRKLTPIIKQKVISDVYYSGKKFRIDVTRNLSYLLDKAIINSIKRKAKYIVIDFCNRKNCYLILHLGMSGRLLIEQDASGYIPAKHDHLVFYYTNGSALIFNDPRRFGLCIYENIDDLSQYYLFKNFGPEPLDDAIDVNKLYEFLTGKTSCIKNILLDSRFIVGVGNIYACEALFEAGIHPLRSGKSISMHELKLLIIAVQNVLKKAIEAGGSTLKDYRHPNNELGNFQNNFTVYNRFNQKCLKCNKLISKVNIGGRGTYFCLGCQK